MINGAITRQQLSRQCYFCSVFVFQGILRVINVSFDSSQIPSAIVSGAFLAELEGILRVKDDKGKMKSKIGGTIQFYGMLNKNMANSTDN